MCYIEFLSILKGEKKTKQNVNMELCVLEVAIAWLGSAVLWCHVKLPGHGISVQGDDELHLLKQMLPKTICVPVLTELCLFALAYF